MGSKAWCGFVLLATAIASQSAAAGDRKSFRDSIDSGVFAEQFTSPRVASVSVHHVSFGSPPVTAFDSRPEHFVENHASAHAAETDRTTGSIDRKISLFHFNTKFGEVGVHPLLGSAKGLQFSLGF